MAACGPEAAAVVHRLTQAAFAGHRDLSPPSGALDETLDAVRSDLAEHGGALARFEDAPVGCLRLDDRGDHLHVRRLAVDPVHQGRGAGRALMDWAEAEARGRGFREVRIGVRAALAGNLDFYKRRGYSITGSHSHPGFRVVTWYSMAKRLG